MSRIWRSLSRIPKRAAMGRYLSRILVLIVSSIKIIDNLFKFIYAFFIDETATILFCCFVTVLDQCMQNLTKMYIHVTYKHWYFTWLGVDNDGIISYVSGSQTLLMLGQTKFLSYYGETCMSSEVSPSVAFMVEDCVILQHIRQRLGLYLYKPLFCVYYQQFPTLINCK